MKKNFFSILAVMLMALTANAQTTITWDYNTIKGINFDYNDYDRGYGSDNNGYRPILFKDGITLSAQLGYWNSPYFKDCTLGSEMSGLGGDHEYIYFCSGVGRITSITITCTDENDALYEGDLYGWNETATSATWTGTPSNEVWVPLGGYREMKGIQQIAITVDDVIEFAIKNMPYGWSANKDLNHIAAGESVTFTTANIPKGTKIGSLWAFSKTGTLIYLTDNGDGTWTLPSMPKCNLSLEVKYVDAGSVGTQYTISNIPDGWKVNGSTTNGTYEANEGAKVIFTPANIPAGKKIKSIKVVKQ